MIKRWIKKYSRDESGQIAVITAITAVPILLGVSVALDSSKTNRSNIQLQAALDSAVLAAVTNQTLTPEERETYATDRFWANMSTADNVKFDVTSSEDNIIRVAGKIQIPTLFAGLIGRDTIELEGTAAAEIVKGSTVCMLALDPNSERSFEITHGAALNANCTVQVNSLHKEASYVAGGGQATAQGFCVGGGATGNYAPFVNTECASLEDPFANIDIPSAPTQCIDQEALEALKQDWRSTRDAVENHEIAENIRWAEALAAGETWYPTYFEKSRLKPGNYCEGLVLDANEFVLEPGLYHITSGSLHFLEGTELIGEDVTFVLYDDVKIHIDNGSIMNIKGPTSGDMDGLVITQNLENPSIYDPSYPDVTSTITDGAILNLFGTVYLPSHKVEFLGGSNSTTHAPATSFIAHQISISDGADIRVSADHVAAGISPIQPRTDDGARLMR